jgi:hypothetical protein
MSDATETTIRPLREIAADIREHWATLATAGYAAAPYVEAMEELDDINGRYFQDSARGIVQYFLGNATAWRGEDARRVKAELKALLKLPRA